MKIYLVGGAVRDQLLGLSVTERDYVVVGATVADMLQLGYRQVGKDFPVFLHPRTNEEYALARVERKIGLGYTGFSFDASTHVTLAEDLLRRDLTMNAIAQSLDDGVVADPYGGQADIDQRVLRHVSPAFAEDPVRILRVGRFLARFQCLGFKVEPNTMALMRQMVVAGEVDALVPERVWKELQRALAEASPEAFFAVLQQCGALDKLFPGIDPQAMLCLTRAVEVSADPVIRFAALLSSLTDSQKKVICDRYRVPAEYAELAYLVSPQSVKYEASEIMALLQSVDAFRRASRFEKYLIASSVSSNNFPVELLRACFHAAKEVDIKEIMVSGVKGKDIAEAVFKKRVSIIVELLQTKP